VPQDERTRDVYFGFDLLPAEAGDLTLRFAGKVQGQRTAKLLLLYPRAAKMAGDKSSFSRTLLSLSDWAETPLTSSLYLAPEAMFSAAAFGRYLEWESHRRAVSNDPIWYVLRRGEVVKDCDSADARRTALRFFGFVPVSPDGSRYRYDVVRQEVSNEGYGTLRRPQLRSMPPTDSPLAQLLEQVRTLRVDLRFREDGIHTILTLDRHAAKK
jgi:hypothetical protein